jgi:transposase
MMRPANTLPVVYVCVAPVDFRKGINGLAVIVEQGLVLNPFCEHLFVFCNRRRDRVKILYWEQSGFCLWQKRLEQARFYWPQAAPGEPLTITGQQLNWLLDGYDISRLRPHKRLCFTSVL